MQNCHTGATHRCCVISYREKVYTQALLNFAIEDKCIYIHAAQGHYLLSLLHSRGRYIELLPKGVSRTKTIVLDKLIMD
jgi:hypothetical protein